MDEINILCIGDIVGKAGRKALIQNLNNIQQDNNIDFTIVNIENASNGFGVTKQILIELAQLDIDVYTSGNHIFNKREILKEIDHFPNLLRPANFPKENPGRGYGVFSKKGIKVGVMNLVGRAFVGTYDCPFKEANILMNKLAKETPVIILDFHAETTSEKQAMGWYLDGKVSAVFGTHTHVITADERILLNGTGYISDIGMTGSYNSVIGMDRHVSIERFLSLINKRLEPVNNGPICINGVKLSIDLKTGNTNSINRIQHVFSNN